MEVRTNADGPTEAKQALEFGAKGIGLCRTEHMFFEPDRIMAMREMIIAENEEDRRKAIMKLLSHQKSDFYEILKTMAPYPVTIRLLDPPLHEFLPQENSQIQELAQSIRTQGIIQPLVVRRNKQHPGYFQLIAGERRWRAAQKAGLRHIPALIQEVSDGKLLALALVENIQRDDLSPVEEAHAYQLLMQQFQLTR